MKLTEILPGIDSPIAFYPDLVPLANSSKAAIFLCQIVYWHGKQASSEGWIYKTQEEWFYETGLSDEEQIIARTYLVKRGFIQEQYIGVPRRLEYRFMANDFKDIWNVWLIAVRIKEEYKKLKQDFEVPSSRAIQDDDVKIKLQKYRQSYKQCERILRKFFKDCKDEGCFPISKLKELIEPLNQIAETLEKL